MAIDNAKARHEVLIAIPGKKRRRRLTVLNQLDDFKRLITTLASYGFPVQVAFVRDGFHLPADFWIVRRAITPDGFGVNTNKTAGSTLRDIMIPHRPKR